MNGPIILRLGDHEGDDYEPDDSKEDTTNIMRINDRQMHTFHKRNDEDWIKIDLTEISPHQIIVVQMLYFNTNLAYTIYDSDGNNLDHKEEEGFNSQISSTLPLNPGYYFLKVYFNEFTVPGSENGTLKA